MSLKPQALDLIPDETARVAHAAFPKGNIYLRIRDELGSIYKDESFVELIRQSWAAGTVSRSPCLDHYLAVCRRSIRSSGGRGSA